jgi:hypothetical protein
MVIFLESVVDSVVELIVLAVVFNVETGFSISCGLGEQDVNTDKNIMSDKEQMNRFIGLI